MSAVEMLTASGKFIETLTELGIGKIIDSSNNKKKKKSTVLQFWMKIKH